MRLLALLLGVVVTACVPEPPPEPTCPTGQHFDADGVTCVPDGCGVGAWGEVDDVDGLVVRVSPDGSDDGDGSASSPLDDVEDAIDRVAEEGGGLVALTAGTWRVNLRLGPANEGLVLAGRCPELSVLDGSEEEEPTLRLFGGSVTVRGVTLSGGHVGALVMPTMGAPPIELQLEEAVLAANLDGGLQVVDSGSRATLRDVVIREPVAAEGGWGIGVDATYGGTVVAEGLVVERAQTYGVRASVAGSRVELTDSVVRGTTWLPDGSTGWGLVAELGATVLATGTVVEDNHEVGVAALNPGSVLELESSEVRGTGASPAWPAPRGLSAQDGGTLVATDVLVAGNEGLGLVLNGSSTSAVLDRVEIRDTLPDEGPGAGRGVDVDQATLTATDLVLDNNREVGLGAFNGAEVELSGLRIAATQPNAEGLGGNGLVVESGASLVAQGLVLEDNHEIGLKVKHEGSSAELTGLELRATRPLGDGTWGLGLVVGDGARLSLADALLEDNQAVGLLVDDPGTEVELQDVRVSGTRAQADGSFGVGLHVGEAAQVVAEGLELEANRLAGLIATRGALVQLTDSTITGTRSGQQAGTGMGLVAQLGGTVGGDGLEVQGSDGPGAYIATGGHLGCIDCVLAGNGFAGLVVRDGSATLLRGEISGSSSEGSHGGGLGALAWNDVGPPSLDVEETDFVDLPGPAVYLRGPGAYRLSGVAFRDVAGASGDHPVPGAVVAVEGVGRWTGGGGLLLEDCLFEELATDGVLLDESSATLDGNIFGATGGLELKTQRCDGVEPPELAQPVITNDCEGFASVLEPRPWWRPDLGEVGAE